MASGDLDGYVASEREIQFLMTLEKNPSTGEVLEVFGPTVDFLTSPRDTSAEFCVIKGTIPPGVSVPLHSHADTEDFVIISGEVEGLRVEGESHDWIEGKAGDFFHVPSSVRHAWRNVSRAPTVVLIITTKKLGRFFQEIGRATAEAAGRVTLEDLARFAAVSARYGYWNATPEENLRVGIQLNFPAAEGEAKKSEKYS
jgi:quercetin dioxygenase-like cupin family protein